MSGYDHDSRIVMTLDAGGTSFRFSAMRGNRRITDTVTTPSDGDNLKKCLANVIAGFTEIKKQSPHPPVAISFAFPGPADYPAGIIGDLPNLPAFRGGVALGPMLEHTFRIPVTINNDGELFAYGEAIAGFLPHVNGLLKKAGSPKRYKNLFGVTLGTGLAPALRAMASCLPAIIQMRRKSGSHGTSSFPKQMSRRVSASGQFGEFMPRKP